MPRDGGTHLISFPLAHSIRAAVRFSLDVVVVPLPSADAVPAADMDVDGRYGRRRSTTTAAAAAAGAVAGDDARDDGAMANAASHGRRKLASLHIADIIGSAHARRGGALLVEDRTMLNNK
jgi:hypothetical protein